MVRRAQERNPREIIIHAPMKLVLIALQPRVKGEIPIIKTLFSYPFKDSKEVWLEIDGLPNKRFF